MFKIDRLALAQHGVSEFVVAQNLHRVFRRMMKSSFVRRDWSTFRLK